MPTGLAVVICDNGNGFYGYDRKFLNLQKVPCEVAAKDVIDELCDHDTDRWMITPTKPMPVREFESTIKGLPWVKLDGVAGQRSLGQQVSDDFAFHVFREYHASHASHWTRR